MVHGVPGNCHGATGSLNCATSTDGGTALAVPFGAVILMSQRARAIDKAIIGHSFEHYLCTGYDVWEASGM